MALDFLGRTVSEASPTAHSLSHKMTHLALLAFYEKRIFKQRALANLNRVKRYEEIQKDATGRDYAPIR